MLLLLLLRLMLLPVALRVGPHVHMRKWGVTTTGVKLNVVILSYYYWVEHWC